MNNRTLLFMRLSVPTDPCRETFQRRKQSMYRNRKKYIKPASWILFLLCFYAAASFTGCDPALFVSRSSHLSDLAADMLRPDLSYFPKILLPLFYTVQMSVTGTVADRFPFWRRIPAFSVMGKAFSASPDPGTPVFSGADPGTRRNLSLRTRNLRGNLRHHALHLCDHDQAHL